MDLSQVSIGVVEIEDMLDNWLGTLSSSKQSNTMRYSFSSTECNSLPLEELDKLYQYMFTSRRRNSNFDIADNIASLNHMFIPGLGTDYSGDELKCWRKNNHFTWHESFDGFYLVPSVIHGNLSHSGLVSRENGLKKTSM